MHDFKFSVACPKGHSYDLRSTSSETHQTLTPGQLRVLEIQYQQYRPRRVNVGSDKCRICQSAS
jgi:hypothetical protein